jgi:hypothetical protein
MNYWNPLMKIPLKKQCHSDCPSKSFFEETICVTIAINLIVFLTPKLEALFAQIVGDLMMKYLTAPMNGGAQITTTPGKRTKAELECQ